ncbi:hypothetical protein BJV78DRAFT_526695 [Lactifluus subvellereus]|nr:hypothetical protein BJV78DRAFT_526695 [Lactifluus subvellereus]
MLPRWRRVCTGSCTRRASNLTVSASFVVAHCRSLPLPILPNLCGLKVNCGRYHSWGPYSLLCRSMGTRQYPVDDDIAVMEHSLSLLPQRHPARPIRLLDLVNARSKRYNLSRQVEDIDKSLLHATEAILLPNRPWAGCIVSVFSLFFAIANALLARSTHSQKVEDVKYSIYYLCYLRGLPLKASRVSQIKVTKMLVQALASHIELVAGDETPTIQAMLRLCYELLRVASQFSGDYLVEAFVGLARGITVEFSRGLQLESLDQVVDCLREAVKTYPPELHQIHLDLAITLQFRFMQTHCEDDYKEAIAVLDNIILSNHLADNPTPYSAEACVIIARFMILRFQNGHPEYIEEVISRCRSWLDCSALRDHGRSTLIQLLAWCLNVRSKQFGLKESLQGKSSGSLKGIVLATFRHLNHYTTASGGPVFICKIHFKAIKDLMHPLLRPLRPPKRC